jgi:Zn-dependent peptidase ImmA (M78 family)
MDKKIHSLIRKHHTNCPYTIAKAINIHIRFADLGNSTRGLYYSKLRRRFIVINSRLNPSWQRFICAHELAHDLFHRGFNRFFLDEYSLFCTNKFERQANEFAVELLLFHSDTQYGETIEQFFMRNFIPKEMIDFYHVH